MGDNESEKESLCNSFFDRFGVPKFTHGKDKERTFTQAFYNSIVLILIIVCTAVVVFTILQPFIKPLLWAVLCGSVLHPFKFGLSSGLKRWLGYLEVSSKPLSVEIASVPIFIFLNLSEFIGNLVISKPSAVCFTLLIASYLLTSIYNYTPTFCFTIVWQLFTVSELLLTYIMNIFQNPIMVAMTITCFLSSITLLWNSENTKLFVMASYCTWVSIAFYVVSFFDYMSLPLFVIIVSMCMIGVFYEFPLRTNKLKEGNNANRFSSVSNRNDTHKETNKPVTEIKNSETTTENINVTNFQIGAKVNPLDESEFTHQSESKDSENDYKSIEDMNSDKSSKTGHLSGFIELLNNHTSDLFIYTMCVACGVIVIVKNIWLLYFIAFLFVLHLTKLFCIGFGIWLLIQEFWDRFTRRMDLWFSSRSDVLFPPPVEAFFKISGMAKRYILSYLKEYCDAVASVSVILALLAVTIFVSGFLCLQIYTEGFYLVKVSGQIINQTVVHNPELTQLLPNGWENQVDSILNSTYTYGREMLAKMLRRMLKDIPEGKADELEHTALEVWDRVYQAWIMTSLEQSIGPKVTSTAVFQSWNEFIDGVKKTPGLMNLNELNSLLVENMTTLSAGLESVWMILKGNANMLLQAVTTLFSVVIGHGAALFGFFIDMIIFLTALYYLLSSSRVSYKPVEILTKMLPQYGNLLAVAMETASKEVVVASCKLLVFYGLWTWFIHNVFLMNITYLPSVLAAILAVVPCLGTYWACLPGVLDLWLAQGKGFHALCLAICQFLPTTIVDTTIYNEMHGGHPYLTGLAVAGGVLYLGTEGAIIGPLALCGLLVIINLSSIFVEETIPS